MDISNTTVTINDSDSELKTCWLADKTGTIALSLRDSQIELVEAGKSYCFTNLTTRKFCENTTLTTTRTSTFTPIHKKISVPTTHDIQTIAHTTHTLHRDHRCSNNNQKAMSKMPYPPTYLVLKRQLPQVQYLQDIT